MTSELAVSSFYDLRDAEAFDRAARLLLARMRLTGMEGIRSYRFLPSGPRGRRLVAVYEGPQAWVDLHDRITPWAESANLRAAARLARVDVYGPLSPSMREWVEELGLGRRVRFLGGRAPVPPEPIRRPGEGRSIFRRLAGG
jgi:hypothetical protein